MADFGAIKKVTWQIRARNIKKCDGGNKLVFKLACSNIFKNKTFPCFILPEPIQD